MAWCGEGRLGIQVRATVAISLNNNMAWCDECDCYFVSEDALYEDAHHESAHHEDAHHEDALHEHPTVHHPIYYYCQTCKLSFLSARELEQHENSIKHLKSSWNYAYEPCKLGCDRLERQEEHKEEDHHWCKLHESRQHQLPRENGQSRKCPGCSRTFPTITAITLHLESGTCESGMNRRKVDQRVHEVDKSGIFTRHELLGCGKWEPEQDIWATERAWNGRAFECYFCDREYHTLGKLNGHITQIHAPKRTEDIYHCPGCGRQFKYFSQLMA